MSTRKHLFVQTSMEMHEDRSQRETLEAMNYYKSAYESHRQMLDDLYVELRAGRPVSIRCGRHSEAIIAVPRIPAVKGDE